MVALEDNLLILLAFFGILVSIAGLGAALWKPVLSRAWAYFTLWWERDKIAEAEAVRLRECRQQAETEIAGEADMPEETAPIVVAAETVTPVITVPAGIAIETPLLQKVRR